MIVYVDLDNTLVDFMSGVKKCSAEDVEKYGKTNDLDNIPGVFAKMEAIEGAVEGFQFLAKHFDTYILSTAPWNNPSAWSDKLESGLPEDGLRANRHAELPGLLWLESFRGRHPWGISGVVGGTGL